MQLTMKQPISNVNAFSMCSSGRHFIQHFLL